MLKKILALTLAMGLSSLSIASVETVKAKLAQQYPNVKINNIYGYGYKLNTDFK